MKVRNIGTKETVYLLTELPDGCPVIMLHRPFAEEATRPQIVAQFANTESGHELAEEICKLKAVSVFLSDFFKHGSGAFHDLRSDAVAL